MTKTPLLEPTARSGGPPPASAASKTRSVPRVRVPAPNAATVNPALTQIGTSEIPRQYGNSWSVRTETSTGVFPSKVTFLQTSAAGAVLGAGFEIYSISTDEEIPDIFGTNGVKKDIQMYRLGAAILRGAAVGTVGTIIFLGISVGASPTLTPVGSVLAGSAVAYRAGGEVNNFLLYIQDGIERKVFSSALKKDVSESAKKAAPRLILHLYSMAAAQRIFISNTLPELGKAEKLIGSRTIISGDPKSREIEILQKILKSADFYNGGIAKKDIHNIFGEGIFSDTSWDEFFKNSNEDILFFKDNVKKEDIIKKIKDPEKRKKMLEFLDTARRNPVTGVLDNQTLKILSDNLKEPVKKIDRRILTKLRDRLKLTLSLAEKAESEAKALAEQYSLSYPPAGKKTARSK